VARKGEAMAERDRREGLAGRLIESPGEQPNLGSVFDKPSHGA